jgi:hypothetical protein
MATSYQRRPDGKAPDQRVEIAQRDRAALDAQLQKVEEQKQALEKREEAGIDPDLASRLQPAMGNAAVAGMLNRATDTATTAAGDTALEERQEEEKEEEGEDKEAGEIEHVLPSFSNAGGGGGGGGHPPWSMGRMFGGDDDDPGVIADEVTPRWRPMPVLPDTDDEDAELEEIEADDAPADPDAVDLREASAALGDATWRPRLLSRGLRHPRLLARRHFGPEDLVDVDGVGTALGRARAMLRFVAAQGDGLDAVLLARAATGAGEAAFAPAAGYAGATARAIALVEVTLACLPPDWAQLLEIVGDGRARARVESVAGAVATAGALSAAALFAEVVGARVAPAPIELRLGCHPAACAALTAAARLDPLPGVDLWTPPERAAPVDPAVAAFDAVLARFTGAAAAPGPGLVEADLLALFDSLNTLLGAIGGVLVEVASAGVALAPFVPLPTIAGVLVETDAILRRAAGRLVEAGEALDTCLGTDDVDRVTMISAEALAVRGTAELTRAGALATLGAELLRHDPAPPELPELLERADADITAGRSASARLLLEAAVVSAPPELEGRVALAAGGALLRMGLDEHGHFAAAAAALGDGALAVGAHALAAGHALARERWETAAAHGAAGLRIAVTRRMPCAAVDATCTLATATARRGGDWRTPLATTGAWLRAADEGGALNLLKARWGELATDGSSLRT